MMIKVINWISICIIVIGIKLMHGDNSLNAGKMYDIKLQI